MTVRFNNIEGMLAELRCAKYNNPYHHTLIHNDLNNPDLLHPTEEQVVNLYNIYCMPTKYTNILLIQKYIGKT